MDNFVRNACHALLHRTTIFVAVLLIGIRVLISSTNYTLTPPGKRFIGETNRSFGDQEVYIQIEEHRLYLYSAIQRSMVKLPQAGTIRHDLVVVGWRHKQIKSVIHKCCVWMHNGDIVAATVTTMQKHNGVNYDSIEFACSVYHASTVRVVSIVEEQVECPRTPYVYVVPYYPGPAKAGFAVCSKISFGAQDAKFLVEWFETVKFLGVSKVISYTYELNDDAMKVLRYYESTGFADVFALDFPDKGSQKIGSPKCRTEKAIIEADCTNRMSNYQYASIMDKDEIIVPEKDDRLQGSLIRFMDSKLQQEPNLGMLVFMTRMHNDTGSHDPVANNMYTEHFSQCSHPIRDAQKYIYLPTRLQHGTVHVHDAKTLPGYQRKTASPQDAVIHHYRVPRGRNYYTSRHRQLEPLVNCTIMQRLAAMVRQSTQTVRSKLGLVGNE